MYNLMVKLETLIKKMLLKNRVNFLLYLYEKHAPKRSSIHVTFCYHFFRHNRFYATLIGWTKKTIISVSTSRESFCLKAFAFCIANILRTTIGASSNYFKLALNSNRFQLKNLFFSFSPQYEG